MSTVAEIEAAIERLPVDEQQHLRERLLVRAIPPGASPPLERETWLNRLAALRNQLGTGKTAATSDAFGMIYAENAAYELLGHFGPA